MPRISPCVSVSFRAAMWGISLSVAQRCAMDTVSRASIWRNEVNGVSGSGAAATVLTIASPTRCSSCAPRARATRWRLTAPITFV